MGREKLNVDFFSVNLGNSTKETPKKGGNNISQFNSFLAQKLSQNFEITLHLLLSIVKYLYGLQFFLTLKELFSFSVPRIEPCEAGVGFSSVQFGLSVVSDSL